MAQVRRLLTLSLQILAEPGLNLPSPPPTWMQQPLPFQAPTSSGFVASPSERTLFPSDRAQGRSRTTKSPAADTTCSLGVRRSRCTPLDPTRLLRRPMALGWGPACMSTVGTTFAGYVEHRGDGSFGSITCTEG